MFTLNSNGKSFNLTEGIKSKILSHDGGLMLVENCFVKGAIANEHAHIHEQAGYIVSGEFEFLIGEEKQILKGGDSFYVGPNVIHGCIAIEAGMVIDTFSPQREDFLEKIKSI